MGIGFGFCTRMILRGLQRFGASAEQQIALTLACGYLSFYVANAPCKVSGEQPRSHRHDTIVPVSAQPPLDACSATRVPMPLQPMCRLLGLICCRCTAVCARPFMLPRCC